MNGEQKEWGMEGIGNAKFVVDLDFIKSEIRKSQIN